MVLLEHLFNMDDFILDKARLARLCEILGEEIDFCQSIVSEHDWSIIAATEQLDIVFIKDRGQYSIGFFCPSRHEAHELKRLLDYYSDELKLIFPSISVKIINLDRSNFSRRY